MSTSPQVSKLEELRNKTDHQLLGMVGKALDRGLALAKLAEAHYAFGYGGQAERTWQKAQRAFDESSTLLSAIRGLRDEVAALEVRREELLRILDSLSRCPETVGRVAASW